ncbi:MAG: hypothetical protein ABIZ30_01805 [Candidatus Limnocylindrales bacterium]
MTTSSDPHATDAMAGPHGADDHGADDHGEDHGHDDHAHGDGEALGPIDGTSWGAGLVGIAAGLVVALVLAMSAGWLG